MSVAAVSVEFTKEELSLIEEAMWAHYQEDVDSLGNLYGEESFDDFEAQYGEKHVTLLNILNSASEKLSNARREVNNVPE